MSLPGDKLRLSKDRLAIRLTEGAMLFGVDDLIMILTTEDITALFNWTQTPGAEGEPTP